MHKVITINLHGSAYQLEEAGYKTLQTYLEKAASKLADNPDKDEIMADFEQAIADKCQTYLSGHKNVVTTKELDELLAAMGPVEDDSDAKTGQAESTAQAQPAPKRLFKIREGAVIEGVCNGIAAYLDVDVTLVRVAFIVLTVLTGGGWIIAYILMAIFIPEARTPEDIAAAQGKPFNAQTLMASARERVEYWRKFGEEQKQQWTANKGEAKQDYKYKYKQWKYEQKVAPKQSAAPQEAGQSTNGFGYFSRGFAGVFGGVGVAGMVLLSVLLAFGLLEIFMKGTLWGYFSGVSPWFIASLIVCVFYVVFLPLQGFAQDSLGFAGGRTERPYFWNRFGNAFLWLIAAAGLVWLVVNVPQIKSGLQQIRDDVQHSRLFNRD